LDKWNN